MNKFLTQISRNLFKRAPNKATSAKKRPNFYHSNQNNSAMAAAINMKFCGNTNNKMMHSKMQSPEKGPNSYLALFPETSSIINYEDSLQSFIIKILSEKPAERIIRTQKCQIRQASRYL
jgi:hypothetical protein